MSAWLPIVSAPEDGTVVLLWTSTAVDAEDREYVESVLGGEHVLTVQVGRNFGDDDWNLALIGKPTHWMPMPPPPALALAAATEGGDAKQAPCEASQSGGSASERNAQSSEQNS